MRHATVKVLAKTTGVPNARIAVSYCEPPKILEGETHAVVVNISAEDSYGMPSVVARLSFSPDEARRVAAALIAIADQKGAKP